MRTSRIFAVVAIVISCTFAAQAQNYTSAIGLRLGYPISVSYKHFLSEPAAIEVFAGYRNYGSVIGNYGWSFFNIGGLYQYHKPISGVENLNWYFGGGASVYFYNYDDGFVYDGDNTSTGFGLLLNLGLDYKFENAPINVTLDWVPTIRFNGYDSGFGGGFGALGVRYVLK